MRLEVEVVRQEVFTFTAHDTGEEIHIMSGQLRLWLLEHVKHKIIDLTFPADEPLQSIIDRHGLEQSRIDSMTIFEAAEPVIVGLWPSGHHVLIDGGHRRYFWATKGVHVLKGWAVPEVVWRDFQFNPADAIFAHHSRDGSLLPHRRKT